MELWTNELGEIQTRGWLRDLWNRVLRVVRADANGAMWGGAIGGGVGAGIGAEVASLVACLSETQSAVAPEQDLTTIFDECKGKTAVEGHFEQMLVSINGKTISVSDLKTEVSNAVVKKTKE